MLSTLRTGITFMLRTPTGYVQWTTLHCTESKKFPLETQAFISRGETLQSVGRIQKYFMEYGRFDINHRKQRGSQLVKKRKGLEEDAEIKTEMQQFSDSIWRSSEYFCFIRGRERCTRGMKGKFREVVSEHPGSSADCWSQTLFPPDRKWSSRDTFQGAESCDRAELGTMWPVNIQRVNLEKFSMETAHNNAVNYGY